jgi:hypothetical protein
MEDSFYQAIGHRLWDASFIRSRVLIIASEGDFWSRPADREALARDLVHAKEVKTVVTPQHGRERFIEEVLSFLAVA